jgi:hypothetical protein
MSFAKEVWERLSSINVNEHAEKKGNLTYLSWSWAWATLMREYPESQFLFAEPVIHPDTTVEVRVYVTVRDGDRELSRECWLPVMDHRNNAIPGPDARKISDTKMRCLVKCMALFGLGLYIFSGEDLPQSEVEGVKAQTERLNAVAVYVKEAINKDDPHQIIEVWEGLSDDDKRAIWVAETKGGYFSQSDKQYIRSALDTLRPKEIAA